jgi:hypothetical protein
VVIARELLRLKAILEEARDASVLIGEAARDDSRKTVRACAEHIDEAISCVDTARHQPEIRQMIEDHVASGAFSAHSSSKSST